MKSTRLLLSVAALSTGLIFSGETRAEDWKLVGQSGFLGIGKGENSLFNRAGVKCPAWADTDFNTKTTKYGGVCILTDLEGDKAYTTWQCAGTPGPGGRCPGTWEWTGGTGKYKEIKGSNTFVGVTSVNWPDGTASGYATWNR